MLNFVLYDYCRYILASKMCWRSLLKSRKSVVYFFGIPKQTCLQPYKCWTWSQLQYFNSTHPPVFQELWSLLIEAVLQHDLLTHKSIEKNLVE